MTVIHRHDFATRAELAAGLAADIASVLASAIEARGAATLAVSGGSTPKLLFAALSHADIDWSRVTVTLVDERFVPECDERSNHRLVAQNLLQGRAATARFLPLYSQAGDADTAAKAASIAIETLPGPFDGVILGMGTDGHTASFFPGGDRLADALNLGGDEPVIAMRAPNAGEPRLTLTLPRLADARLLALHIEGAEKQDVLARALEAGDESDMPVRAILRRAKAPLDIYWAP